MFFVFEGETGISVLLIHLVDFGAEVVLVLFDVHLQMFVFVLELLIFDHQVADFRAESSCFF